MSMAANEKEFLKNYNIHDYDVPLTSVDIVIFTIIDDRVNVLITQRADFPFKGKWATPGGFIDVKNDQTIEATAIRKLKEKTGFDAPYLEQMGSIGNAKRDPRGWSVTVTYFALVNEHNVTFADDCCWCPLDENGETSTKLAFDHNLLIKEAFLRLQNKAQYSTIALHVLPEKFTLSELQQTYEIILGGKLNKAGFRRRILKANVIEKLEGESKQTATRTAQLYRKLDQEDVHFYMREIYAR
ncbi:NUDIX hydrolase [Pleionea litopenaei]|uniref:NUDIX domain-containing protein n=1 Tax=Pleionea litopenaei TaxID=3070815 RepID=A0AA51RQY3_9GAMM|nr:NUDIX domain-containing protein [Pleionea sp. HL-JVS1]WMS85903.1 NUDIX domain-containing protein [Pleionea sp. HL-JVS1]